jgi:hypothetical protein
MAILSGKIRRGDRGYAGLSHPFGKARKDAAECRLISDLATDTAKRELFDRLASHLIVLADQVEQEMIKRKR